MLAPVDNGDLAWHLALGRWIAAHGAVPRTEPFTYTAGGAPMVAHEWLVQWGYWELLARAGIAAFRWAHAAAAAAFVALVYALLRRAGATRGLALAGLVVCTVGAAARFQVRPHVVNLLVGAALYGAAFVARPKLRPAQIAGFAIATALWANAHSAAVLFPALVAGYALADALDRRLRPAAPRERDALGGGDPRRVWQLAGACALALVATPNHVALFPYLVESARVNASLSLEWLPILRYAGDPTARALLAAFAIALAAGTAAALALARRGAPLAPAAVALACAVAPLRTMRFTWLAFAPVALAGAEASRALARAGERTRCAVAVLATLGALVAAPLLFAPAEGVARRIERVRAGTLFAPNAFPVRSAALLDELARAGTPLEGRLFARAEWGGYLNLVLNGRYLVFADGRWPEIGEGIVRAGHVIATGRPGALDLADDFALDLLLVERDWLDAAPAPERARRDAAWLRAFASANSELWVRRDATGTATRATLADYYAAHGVPFDAERGFDPLAARAASPQWARAHGIGARRIRHFLPGGRRSEPGFEVAEDGVGAPGDAAP
ncbi:MAG: hypothetical protein R3E88_18370 [Myxococcota bacterium]